MARRLALLVLVVFGLAIGGYYAWSWWQGPPEQAQRPPEEKKIEPAPAPPAIVTGLKELLQRELVGAFAVAPDQGLHGVFPWQPLLHLADNNGFTLENLLESNPLRFLELCAERYDREVHSYNLLFVKKERVKGKLHPPDDKYEKIQVAFREKPSFGVLFVWKENPRNKLAAKALYVEGENKNKIVGKGKLPIILEYDLNSAEARNNGRYTMAEFGLGKAMHRTVRAMQKAKEKDTLHVRYEGRVALKELDDRPCYKFVRTPYTPPEDDDGVYELIIYIDCETWLQVGSILHDSDGNLLAEYYFRDIELNPEFTPKQFTKAGL